MKRKQVMACALAASMTLGASMSVFAATGDATGGGSGNTVTGDGDVSYVDTTVYSVTLPTSASIKLTVDPQGLTGLGSGDSASADDLTTYAGKVTCSTVPTVTNLSSVPMKVSAKLTLTGDATGVATYADVEKDDTTDNNILLYAIPSSVDTKGSESNYAASTVGIPITTTATDVDFILPAADYTFTKDETGKAGYALVDGSGHGSGLAFGGYVNKNADWSDYVKETSASTIGMTAVFSYTSTLADADKADTTAGAPYAMKAMTGTITGDEIKVELNAAPSVGDVNFTIGSGDIEIPYSLGSGSLKATKVNDCMIDYNKVYQSAHGMWGSSQEMAEYFVIGNDKITIKNDYAQYLAAGDYDFYVQFDEGDENIIKITISISE